ncbi:hypothetical protein [Sphaerisporangium aureirubrum]|uniref:Uncharacterized protein n=1 Tax=Sphaerisporangium aureirubrum TaxID=1544736 RepID=A0ABW1NMZ4_9ACTN
MSQAKDRELPSPKELRAQAHRDAVKGTQRAFQSPPRGDRRPPRVVSDAERQGVPPTDTRARSPLGVGQSTTTRPERLSRHKPEPGRHQEPAHPRTGRPAGTSTPEYFTGVAPHPTTSPDGH